MVFTTETDKTIEGIKALLRGEDGLVDAEGYSIYKDAFAYLLPIEFSKYI